MLLAKIIPTAPALAACTPLSVLSLSPRRQTTIFPLAFFESRVPFLQRRLQQWNRLQLRDN